MYTVELRLKAQHFLDKLSGEDFEKVIDTIKALAHSPRSKGVLWRIREGDYRILYKTDEARKTVTVLRIGHRRELFPSV